MRRSSTDRQDQEGSVQDLFSLKRTVSVVVGGSGGLGGAISLGLSQFGSTVILAGRNLERLTDIKKRIEGSGGAAGVESLDVLKPKEFEDVAARIFKQHRKVDILVNAHGINRRIPTEDYPISTWENVVDVNLRGVFLSCKAFGRYMIRQRSGKIINLSSVAGASGYEWGYSAYAPSKAGVDSLTRTLAVEWGKYGITVNALAPYLIRTTLTEKFLANPKVYERAIGAIPLGRLGSPRDVVGVVIFLASHAADWINGEVINVDGGYMAH